MDMILGPWMRLLKKKLSMDAVIEEKSSMDADLGSTKGSRNKKLAEESSYAKGRTRIGTTTNGRGVEAERGVSRKRARKHVGSCGKAKEGTSDFCFCAFEDVS
ncbi:hypothetical protein L6452_20248 [Arctium lappa]|uniref:Uncharacterized protein n=1 Tax=Arctium lappa TaxID=4217 RepID=A0ACB9BC63_ARCLA|nr:hypothetical protein L6452_20248 [Arctium lappa]